MSKIRQSPRAKARIEPLLAIVALLLVSGCTSPLWWHDPDRGFIYRGWGVNVADQATVMHECAAGYPVLGCVKPDTMTAFSVNNPYVLAHECRHIENIMNAEAGAGEKLKDAFYMLFGINDLLTAATSMLPAPNSCGDGTMAEWQDGKVIVIQASYGPTHILPTLEEWQRQDAGAAQLR